MNRDLHDLRVNYTASELLEMNIDSDPMVQFAHWFKEYERAAAHEANTVCLSTYGNLGPSSRIVLLKSFDARGFVFYTNYESRKAKEAEASAKVGMLFFWPELERQLRVQGQIERIEESESDRYFNSRPFESRMGALASNQSKPIKDRTELEHTYAELTKEWEGKEVERPKNWGGYRVVPIQMEFWQGRASRLHDRIEYNKEGQAWKFQRLAP